MTWASILSWLSLFLSLLCCCLGSSFPPSELSALQQIYESTDGDNWEWRPITQGMIWSFSSFSPNPCTEKWQGITCTLTAEECSIHPCYVQQIHLNAYKIWHHLPDVFQDLPHLTHINMSQNHLSGEMPKSIMSLVNLLSVGFDTNNFHGHLPFDTTISCVKLEVFKADANALNGTISEGIGKLTQLRTLTLSDNRLEGNFPTVLCSLRNLERLDLQYNRFRRGDIPACIGEMQQLKYLDLSHNHFVGKLPSNFATLHALEELTLDNNALDGSLPQEILSLSSLRMLSLTGNNFNGTLPMEMMLLPNLTIMRLARNFLSGPLPSSQSSSVIALNRMLTDCDLTGNRFNGSFPSSWVTLFPHMGWLSLNNNRLRGNLSEVRFHVWKDLTHLELSLNRFTGSFPLSLTNVKALKVLYLNFNLLTGSIPNEIEQLRELRRLAIGVNFFTGTIPSVLGNCHSLMDLDMGWNHLEGPIPDSLGSLKILNTLDIYKNGLTGTIPLSIWNSTSLSYLHLSDNFLNGSIGAEAGRMFGFHEITLSNNLLSGNLSVLANSEELSHKLIGRLEVNRLASLNLDSNHFTGSLPPFNLSNLYQLQLQYNHFTGSLNFTSLLKLASFNMARNLLDRCIEWDEIPRHSLALFNVSDNQIECSLPDTSLSWPSLKAFDISTNRFQGSIHSFFNQMPKVDFLYVSGNQFTGNLDSLFFSSTEKVHSSLKVLDISNNQFSGALPEHLFMLPKLIGLFASLNCLSGSLPSTLCHAANLTSLILDGMGSSPACNAPIFSFLGRWVHQQQAYLASRGSRQNPQAVLDCLFTNAQNLKTLHLSGLGIHGSLPSGLTALPPRLRQVSLSNNYLTGVIPSVFFTHGKFTELDLSFNQLVGGLEDFVMLPLGATLVTDGVLILDEFIPQKDVMILESYNHSVGNVSLSNRTEFVAKDISVRFQINRLSGTIPFSYSSIKKVNILDGNSFDCKVTSQKVNGGRYELVSELPPHDPDYSSYICGSHNVNSVLYLWVALMTVLVMLVVAYLVRYQWPHTQLYFQKCCSKLSSLCTRLDDSLQMKVWRVCYGCYKSICFLLFATEQSQSNWVNDSFNALMEFNQQEAFKEVNTAIPNVKVNTTVPPSTSESPVIDLEANPRTSNRSQYLSASKRYVHDRLVSVYRGYLVILRHWIQHYLKLIVLVIGILVPLYIGMKTLTWSDAQTNEYITYHHQYLWLISACYMRGVVPTVLFGCVFAWILYHYIRQMEHYFAVSKVQKQELSELSKSVHGCNQTNVNANHLKQSWFDISAWRLWGSSNVSTSQSSVDAMNGLSDNKVKTNSWLNVFRLSVVIVCCMILIVTINGVYVFASQENVSSTEKAFLSLLLSMFKTLSNYGFMVMFSSHRILYLLTGISSRDASVSLAEDVDRQSSHNDIINAHFLSITYLLIAIICFSYVFAPYIAEALVGKSCYYYATISHPPLVSSKVPIQKCILAMEPGYLDAIQTDYFTITGTDGNIATRLETHPYIAFCYEEMQTISYYPPFTYSYTCSASLLTTFADVFILRSLWTGLVSPVLIAIAYYYYNQYLLSIEDHRMRRQIHYRIWGMVLPYAWKSLLQIERLVDSLRKLWNDTQTEIDDDTEERRRALLTAISDRYEELVQLRTTYYAHCGFDHRRFCVPLVTDWFLFLTLGVLLPPLGFCIFVSVMVHVSQNLMWMRRYMLVRQQWQEVMQRLQESGALLKFTLCPQESVSKRNDIKPRESWISSIVSRSRSVEISKSSNSMGTSTASNSDEDMQVQMVENPLNRAGKENASVEKGNTSSIKTFDVDGDRVQSEHTFANVCNKLNRIFTNNEERLIVEWELMGHCLYTPVPYLAVVVTLFWSFTLFDTLGAAVGSENAYSVFVLFPAVVIVYVLFVYRMMYLTLFAFVVIGVPMAMMFFSNLIVI